MKSLEQSSKALKFLCFQGSLKWLTWQLSARESFEELAADASSGGNLHVQPPNVHKLLLGIGRRHMLLKHGCWLATSASLKQRQWKAANMWCMSCRSAIHCCCVYIVLHNKLQAYSSIFLKMLALSVTPVLMTTNAHIHGIEWYCIITAMQDPSLSSMLFNAHAD